MTAGSIDANRNLARLANLELNISDSDRSLFSSFRRSSSGEIDLSVSERSDASEEVAAAPAVPVSSPPTPTSTNTKRRSHKKTVLVYKPISLDEISDGEGEDEEDDADDPMSNSKRTGVSEAATANTTPHREPRAYRRTTGDSEAAVMYRGESLTDLMKNSALNHSDHSAPSSPEAPPPPKKEVSLDTRPASVVETRPGLGNRKMSAISFRGTENLETGSVKSFDSEYSDAEKSLLTPGKFAAAAVVANNAPPKYVPSRAGQPKDDDESLPSIPEEAKRGASVNFGDSINIKTGSILHRAISHPQKLQDNETSSDSTPDSSNLSLTKNPKNVSTFKYRPAQARTSIESNASMSSNMSKTDSVSSLQYPSDMNIAPVKKSATAPVGVLRESSIGTNSSKGSKGNDRGLAMSALSQMSSASTVDYNPTSNNSTPVTPASANKIQNNNKKKSKKDYSNRLTKISAMYDLDGDGVLDDIEQAMRDRDIDGDGQLDNAEVHKIIMDRIKNEREVGMYRKVAVGLVCLVCVLALSSFGTSWASVILSREIVAEPESGTIQNNNGEIMGYQEISHEIDLEPLTDLEWEQRRLMVDAEMLEDPDHEDHIHRRLGKKDKNHACTCTKIAYDHGKIKERDLQNLIKKCDGVNTVTLKRAWKSGDLDVDTMCGPGTVVVKKGKKKNNKNKTKTKVVEDVIKFRRKGGKKGKGRGSVDQEVSFSCEKGYCYGSGQTLLQQEGHPCELSRESNGAGECDDGLVCYDPDGDRFGTGTCTLLVQYARKNQVCDLDYGVDACESGYACYSNTNTFKRSRTVGVVNTGTCQKLAQRVRNQDVCDASFGRNACDDGYTCIGENEVELNGWGVGYCQRLVVKQRSGGLCDLSLGRDACDSGFYCRDSMLARNGRNNGAGLGSGGIATTNAIISGPSGTIVAGNAAGGQVGLRARSVGTGTCARMSGRGDRCGSDDECGWNGTCVGLGADTATGGVIRGSSGTIVWGTGGATVGYCG